jgi:hypothetical protein
MNFSAKQQIADLIMFLGYGFDLLGQKTLKDLESRFLHTFQAYQIAEEYGPFLE